MEFPKELKYTKEHEWITDVQPGVEVVIGVTAFAVDQLGDIVHVDLPKVGTSLEVGGSFGTIESTKTVSDLYTPVKGSVIAVNDQVKNNLESIQTDPYKSGWLIKLKVDSSVNVSELKLMSADEYSSYLNDQ